jgi:hypothetical protein
LVYAANTEGSYPRAYALNPTWIVRMRVVFVKGTRLRF